MTVRYVSNSRGVVAMMKSPGMASCVEQYAERIAAGARSIDGENYGSRSKIGRVSAHGYAFTASWNAMRSNAENDTLSRALGGGI